MRVTDRSLTLLDALIVTDWYMIDWEGIPDITPVVELRDNPIGRDPDKIEKERSSPSITGVIENDSSLAIA